MMKKKLRLPVQMGFLAIVSVVLLFPSGVWTQTLTSTETAEDDRTALNPAPAGITGDEIFRQLVEHSHLRDQLLKRYSAVRTYRIGNTQGKVYARAVVEVQYRAPDQKAFAKRSEEGSWMARHLVLDRLIESEAKTSSGRDHRDSSINPRNYSFRLLGEQQVGPYTCYVVEVTPKREDKYLFEGRMWISEQDFGIVRIAGHPVKKLSFWVERVDFVRQYEKIGPFWLPQRDSSVARVRLNGKKVLMIDHSNYTINGEPGEYANAQIPPSESREMNSQSGALVPARSRTRPQSASVAEAGPSGEIR